jgi:glycosyltransferase involved in cell wall biosynthesis
MKLLLWGALDAGTGFGTVTLGLGRAFMGAGVDCRFVGINDVEAAPPGYTVIPLGMPQVTADMTNAAAQAAFEAWIANVRRVFAQGYEGWVPDTILVTGDPASIIRSDIPSLLPPGVAAWHYCPIEGVGIPPRWREMWRGMKPIAMCDFGAGEIERITGTRPPFVYHGVDTEAFWPVSAQRPIVLRTDDAGGLRVLRSKEDCKALFGIAPDRVMLLRTDRNMPRKRFGSMLRAVAPVLARHPEVELFMHCRTTDEGGNLDDFRSHFPRELAARMRVFGYWDREMIVPREILNAMYNAADVYLSTSAEGFGLTPAEALACSVPVVAMDFTSLPEVVGDAGMLVPPSFLVENIYGYAWANVDEAKYTEAVEFLVTHKSRRAELGRLGPKHVASMTWTAAAAKFLSIIDVKEAVAA